MAVHPGAYIGQYIKRPSILAAEKLQCLFLAL
jgi:hypothetical protein